MPFPFVPKNAMLKFTTMMRLLATSCCSKTIRHDLLDVHRKSEVVAGKRFFLHHMYK